MRREFHGLTLLAGLTLSGCVSTAVAVVKAPFRVVGAGIDTLTSTQSERDEDRGREMRKQDEARGKEMRRQQQAEEKAFKRAEKDRRRAERAAREG